MAAHTSSIELLQFVVHIWDMTVPQGGSAKFCCFFVKIAMCTTVTSAGEISTDDVYRRKLSLIHVFPPFCLVHVLELGTTVLVWIWRSDDNVERPVLSLLSQEFQNPTKFVGACDKHLYPPSCLTASSVCFWPGILTTATPLGSNTQWTYNSTISNSQGFLHMVL